VPAGARPGPADAFLLPADDQSVIAVTAIYPHSSSATPTERGRAALTAQSPQQEPTEGALSRETGSHGAGPGQLSPLWIQPISL